MHRSVPAPSTLGLFCICIAPLAEWTLTRHELEGACKTHSELTSPKYCSLQGRSTMARMAATGVHPRQHPPWRRDNRGPGPISPGTGVKPRIRSELGLMYYVRSLRSGDNTTSATCSFTTGKTGEPRMFLGMRQILDEQLPKNTKRGCPLPRRPSLSEKGKEEKQYEARQGECPITNQEPGLRSAV